MYKDIIKNQQIEVLYCTPPHPPHELFEDLRDVRDKDRTLVEQFWNFSNRPNRRPTKVSTHGPRDVPLLLSCVRKLRRNGKCEIGCVQMMCHLLKEHERRKIDNGTSMLNLLWFPVSVSILHDEENKARK
eukprot:CCRYP_017516-RA/>CCRYP_017516-RA protein AED:0.27 eAED:0.61 QI:55/0/0.5/1/0/0/4/158/129